MAELSMGRRHIDIVTTKRVASGSIHILIYELPLHIPCVLSVFYSLMSRLMCTALTAV